MGFGSHGINFLQKALDAHGGDLEQTVEALLGGWTGKTDADNRKSKNTKKKGSQGSGTKASKTQSRTQPDPQSTESGLPQSVRALFAFMLSNLQNALLF